MRNVLFQFYLKRASRLTFQRVKTPETTPKSWNNLFQSFISVLFYTCERLE